jgi:hypothetical protein
MIGAITASAAGLEGSQGRWENIAMAGRSVIPIAAPFAIGLIFLAAATVSLFCTARFLDGAIETQASFAGNKVRSGGSHGRALYDRQFSFRTRDGREVTFVAAVGSAEESYISGQRVTIVYDPANPENAELYSFWSLWAMPLFLTHLALLFTGMAAVLFVLRRCRRDLQPRRDFV